MGEKLKSFSDYETLRERMADLEYLGYADAILGWDMKTYMPRGGIEQRSRAISILSRIIHEKFVDKKNGVLIQNCLNHENDISVIQKRNVELWKRDYDKATKLPSDLVQRLSEQEAKTESEWEIAKHKADFPYIRNQFEKLIVLVKEKAYRLNPSKDPYDVLLDLYEPNLNSAKVTEYFTELRTAIVNLLDKIMNAKSQPDPKILNQSVALNQQKAISDLILKFVGLDPDRSRLDVSEHPFTTGKAADVRITTHYLDNDPIASVYSVFHEAGHALYEQNLPQEHLWTGIGNAISLGVHESQSRFCENIIGKNPRFLQYFIPKLSEIIPGFKTIPVPDIIRSINQVKPSKIRIYADELTYSLHVILRFELERDLIKEKCTVAELPQLWKDKMTKYLNVKIDHDGEGVLQDTHWYGGLIGYFPTYVLGNIYNGQMWHIMQKSILDWKERLLNGDFSPFADWIRKNIHQAGALYDPVDLMKKATGEDPNPKYFITYLQEKFTDLYSL